MREDRGSVANGGANRFNGAPPKADRVNDNLERVRASAFSGSGILWLRYAASTLSVSSRLAKIIFLAPSANATTDGTRDCGKSGKP